MLPFPLVPVAASPSKHLTAYCTKCTRYDAWVVPGGASIDDARCARCGGALISAQKKQAKAHAWNSTFERIADDVRLAAAGKAPIERAVEHATWAAHIAFAQRLVPYGPPATK